MTKLLPQQKSSPQGNQMAESFKLWYYIEGKNDVASVSISPSKTVYDLAKLIHHHDQGAKLSEYSVGDLSLTNLKVRHIMISE
jgi:hypothetical protein